MSKAAKCQFRFHLFYQVVWVFNSFNEAEIILRPLDSQIVLVINPKIYGSTRLFLIQSSGTNYTDKSE